MADGERFDETALPPVPVHYDYPEIREAVAAICARYPGAYWRKLEDAREYPHEFVDALTDAGYLAALIPEEFGGSGLPIRAGAVILETIHAAGCSAGACHAQMYMMGTVLRHGSDEQKHRYLPDIAAGKLRLQAFGVSEPTTGSDTTQLKTRAVRDGDVYRIYGQKIWTSRARHSDLMLLLARTTPKEEVTRRTDGLSVFLLDIQENLGNGLEIHPIDTMVNHLTNEVFFDGAAVPIENRLGDEGSGFRYILDGMNADRGRIGWRCAVLHPKGHRLRVDTRGLQPADRAESGDSIPHSAGLCGDAGRRPDESDGSDTI